MTNFKNEIRSYLDASFPIIYLHTFEEDKAKQEIRAASRDTDASSLVSLVWDGTDRVCDLNTGELRYETAQYSLERILDECWDEDARQILVLENISAFMDDPAVAARLKKMAEKIHLGEIDATIFIISPVLRILPELEKYITVLEIDHPEEKEIRDVIQEFCAEREIWISETLKKEFAGAFKGLSEFEIKNILQLAYAGSGEFRRSHISLIFDQKKQMIKKAGMLEMVPLEESLSDIGGLENLKQWLIRKNSVLSQMEEARAFGVDVPKGVLIAGVPGCGKSLSAKAAAKLFHIPLLRLDMGQLMGKYVGESEGNLRRAIKLTEAISPCVLWIDELEKAFAGIGGDGSGAEVTTRLFGTFLTWLQEKKSTAFVVATANDITKLPPELLRKGRFDEIFYVGLPALEERKKIFEIHIKKRREKDLSAIDLDSLARETEGYSGADIEGVVRESVEMAFARQQETLSAGKDKKGLTTEDIRNAIKNTHSLSEIMREPIKKMEEIYKDRKFKNASK